MKRFMFEEVLTSSLAKAWQRLLQSCAGFTLPGMHYSYLCYTKDSLEPGWRAYGYNSTIVNQVLATLVSEHNRDVLFVPSVYESMIPGHFERDVLIASEDPSELPGIVGYLVKRVEEYHLTKMVCPARVAISVLTPYLLRKNVPALQELKEAKKTLNDFIDRVYASKRMKSAVSRRSELKIMHNPWKIVVAVLRSVGSRLMESKNRLYR